MLDTIIRKLSSRKFIVSLAGIASGIAMICAGSTGEGAVTLATSVIGYLIAEGFVDAASVKSAAKIVAAVDEKISDDGAEIDGESTDAYENTGGEYAEIDDENTAAYENAGGEYAEIDDENTAAYENAGGECVNP